MKLVKFALIALALGLGGCAHRTVLAPCDPSESPVPIGGKFVTPTADCGYMKPVNQ
jgi:hypothetical protein